MNKFSSLAVIATLAILSLVPVVTYAADAVPTKVFEGEIVYGADGKILAPVYRVNTDGCVQVIMEGRLVTVPATVLTEVNGKLTSAKNKSDLLR